MNMEQIIADDYKTIISELVKKQIEVVGPTVALSVARKVSAIKISPEGNVLEISGEPKAALEQAAETYIAFSGEISKMIIKSVIAHHPEIKINL